MTTKLYVETTDELVRIRAALDQLKDSFRVLPLTPKDRAQLDRNLIETCEVTSPPFDLERPDPIGTFRRTVYKSAPFAVQGPDGRDEFRVWSVVPEPRPQSGGSAEAQVEDKGMGYAEGILCGEI